ncbi:MAG: UDP-N-acetylmuramoyl-L-alanyl-D-glutamate--2,6-diaminopimelate ligase, partial [Chloroflexota bacterium]
STLRVERIRFAVAEHRNRRAILRDLAATYRGASITGAPDTCVTEITIDSRLVEPGDLFVALRGGYSDGHDFVPQAIERGATALLVDRPDKIDGLPAHVPAIVVDDSRAALSAISARFFDYPSRQLTLVGVTGTDGKTTTCFLIHQLLATLGKSAGLITTVAIKEPGKPQQSAGRQTTPESHVTQRLLRRMADAGADAVVLETSSHALVTHRVDHCDVDIGVVTNVTSEHLDFHGSREEYLRAKGELLRKVAEARTNGGRGDVILNREDEGARRLLEFAGGTNVVTFSAAASDADVRAANVTASMNGTSFSIHYRNQTLPAEVPLIGGWNVSNALAAASTGLVLGFDLASVVNALSAARPVPGRMEQVRAGQPFDVIVDYAHTPEALSLVLGEIRSLTKGKVLVLIGSAGERDVEKRPELGRIAVTLSDYSVFSSEDPRFEDPEAILADIAQGARESGARDGTDFTCIEDRSAALSHIIDLASPGDVVVLAGKGHETSMIYGSEMRPWNEVDRARNVLYERGYRGDGRNSSH